MVQIIQSQPTQRQSALEQALGQAVQGFGANYMQGQQTLRQQALADQQMNLQLAQMGIDANAQDLRDYAAGTYKPKVIEAGKDAVPAQYKDLQGPVQPGKQLGKMEAAPAQEAVAPVYASANPMMNFTAQRKAQIEAEKAKLKREEEAQSADIAYKKAQTANMEAESPYKTQKIQAEINKINSDANLSPITKRKLLAEAQKAEAEAGKISRESTGTSAAGARLSKMSAEAQSKVGAIASGLKAFKGMKDAVAKGITPSRLDANTPFVGTLFSDNQFTQNQRMLDEVIGRLQSGGAIGTEEIKTFRSLGPRPGDSKDIADRKLADQESFLRNKLTAFGLKEADLSGLGFDTGEAQARSIGTGESQAIMKQVQGMSRAEKIKILQGGA